MTKAERTTVCDTTRSAYKHWTSVTLRYGDTDRQGHINKAVYCTLYESGRVAFLFTEEGSIVEAEGANLVIARLALDYLQEMKFPGTAEIGSKVLAIGRSSFHVGQGIFMGVTCYSTADSVIVLINPQTKRSTPLTARLIEHLKQVM
jgi:acyl-CoA thioester hydrolase